jgi:hypothetical protein
VISLSRAGGPWLARVGRHAAIRPVCGGALGPWLRDRVRVDLRRQRRRKFGWCRRRNRRSWRGNVGKRRQWCRRSFHRRFRRPRRGHGWPRGWRRRAQRPRRSGGCRIRRRLPRLRTRRVVHGMFGRRMLWNRMLCLRGVVRRERNHACLSLRLRQRLHGRQCVRGAGELSWHLRSPLLHGLGLPHLASGLQTGHSARG